MSSFAPRPINIVATCALLLASVGHAQRVSNSTLNFPSELATGAYTTETLFSLGSVLAIDSPTGASNHLYLAERSGRIQLVSDLEQRTFETALFLDISARVTTDLENGLLGLAFHPQYETNGYFYLFYTTRASGQATDRLSRFSRSNENPLRADPGSELILFDQRDQANNHNGGDIHFGPDGYLYIAVGDEGGGNDSYQNGQYIDKDLFAGLLRIDVDKRPASSEPTRHEAIPLDLEQKAAFSIPADNPLVPHWQAAGSDPNSKLRLEFFAIGLRNPWRFTFDSITGDIWVADVGQNAYEEVNLVVKGGNYGWPVREAFHDGPGNRDIPPEFGPLLDPVFEYGRDLGSSITGGAVYRGSALPELYGAYVFSDFNSGRVWALRKGSGPAPWAAAQIASISNAATYGLDPSDGELLAARISGTIEKLVRPENSQPNVFPATLSASGAFADLSALAVESGIYAYDVNLPFWSDYAIKQRWVSIPENETVGYHLNDPWQLPTGSVWIKHFDLETERGNPNSKRRVETRFIVKTDAGAYGLSYQWNEAQSDATLVPENGASIDYAITVDGHAQEQTWTIPSRQQCLSCHTEAAGFALSFNARQLNHDGQHDGQTENTLQYFSRLGVLDTELNDISAIPAYHSPSDANVEIGQRARDYLAVNCVSCHQPNAGTPNSWDARPFLTFEQTKLLDGQAANDGGNASNRLFASGAPEKSILADRLAGRNGFTRMPPFGTELADAEGIGLITKWISSHGAEERFQAWQELHFSSAAAPEAAADEDPDRDGNSNRLEYLNGTLPLDPRSVWKPEFTRDGNSLTVRFAMAPGRSFLIEKSDDLSHWTDWIAEGNPPTSTSAQAAEASIQGDLADGDGDAFYRISVDD